MIGAFGKLMPPAWRTVAFGAGTAAGSFGQFLFSPLGVSLIDAFGWQIALQIFAGTLLLKKRSALQAQTLIQTGTQLHPELKRGGE